METQACAPGAVTLFFSREDLELRGYPFPLTAAQARQLVRSALLAGGQAPWDSMEIDLFTYGSNLLLIARQRAETVLGFRFQMLEDLIQAVRLLPVSTPSVLLWADDAFLLLPGILDTPFPRSLYEFGTPVRYAPLEWAHLQEHGKILMPRQAVFALRRYFTD